ncbi:MAG: substrate-binding domain-containing protein [Gordonia amarae]
MGRHIEGSRSSSGSRRSSLSSGIDEEPFGFEPDSRRRRHRWGLTLTALALIAIIAAALLSWREYADGCGGDRTSVSVVVDPAMADVIGTIAGQASEKNCFDYALATVASKDVPAQLSAGGEGADLWVADTRTRAERVTEQVRKKPAYITTSLASSPVVVVGSALRGFRSWVDVMNTQNLQVSSPVDDSTGDAPIVGGVTAVADHKISNNDFIQAMTVMAVQRHSVTPEQDTDDARLTRADASGAPAVTSEQQYLEFLKTHKGSRLVAKIPADGTLMLDYPLVNTAPENRHDLTQSAGQALAEAARSESGRRALNASGYRYPDGSGIGDKVKLLDTRNTKTIDKALRSWQKLSTPLRLLNLLDASGSMRDQAGPATRADLAAGTAINGTKLLGGAAQVGVWIFGINKGGPGQDWKEIVPVRRLDATAGGVVQRDAIATKTRQAMKNQLGGGTGLYDSMLAAYKMMVDSYDPTANNQLCLVTDGHNEDANSISLDELIDQLKRLQNPTRPVRIIAIGISADADADALDQIAEVTGGKSYSANTPDDIRRIATSEADVQANS